MKVAYYFDKYDKKEVDLLVIPLENEDDFLAVDHVPALLKKKFPNIKILFSGPYANQNPWQVLFRTKADFVCIGDDDETTILELCKHFDNPLMYTSILGLGHKTQTFLHGKFRESIVLGNKRKPKKPKG